MSSSFIRQSDLNKFAHRSQRQKIWHTCLMIWLSRRPRVLTWLSGAASWQASNLSHSSLLTHGGLGFDTTVVVGGTIDRPLWFRKRSSIQRSTIPLHFTLSLAPFELQAIVSDDDEQELVDWAQARRPNLKLRNSLLCSLWYFERGGDKFPMVDKVVNPLK